MKKFLVVFSLMAFLAASSISVSTAVAADLSIEMVKFDKDPSKKADKKQGNDKDAKTTTASETKSACGSSATSTKTSCCKGMTKSDCGGTKTASAACPDKK